MGIFIQGQNHAPFWIIDSFFVRTADDLLLLALPQSKESLSDLLSVEGHQRANNMARYKKRI